MRLVDAVAVTVIVLEKHLGYVETLIHVANPLVEVGLVLGLHDVLCGNERRSEVNLTVLADSTLHLMIAVAKDVIPHSVQVYLINSLLRCLLVELLGFRVVECLLITCLALLCVLQHVLGCLAVFLCNKPDQGFVVLGGQVQNAFIE